MENTSHTNGPWLVYEATPSSSVPPSTYVTSREGLVIATHLHNGTETPAIARLFAAAPDLLTCTRFLKWVCADRLAILAEEVEPDPEVVEHFRLLKEDATRALAKALSDTLTNVK